jgi:hypothetical protein
MENIRQFRRGPTATPEMRSNWLSNRSFRDQDEIIAHRCQASSG